VTNLAGKCYRMSCIVLTLHVLEKEEEKYNWRLHDDGSLVTCRWSSVPAQEVDVWSERQLFLFLGCTPPDLKRPFVGDVSVS
jgi:hypothetical protein